ncbi:MAG: PP2C family protein-serine/threonine phosphatase [Butyrivibrio sp.]|nr:PP2C family protein-serine/threonine phosphatase [Butyrivibrio sp.]
MAKPKKEKKRKKKNRHIIAQVGVVVVLVFALMSFVSVLTVLISGVGTFFVMLQENSNSYMSYAASSMTDYKALSWLMDYWTEHPDVLETTSFSSALIKKDTKTLTPEEQKKREETLALMDDIFDDIAEILAQGGHNSLDYVTMREAEGLTPELQRSFAISCFWILENNFHTLVEELPLKEMSCTMPMPTATVDPRIDYVKGDVMFLFDCREDEEKEIASGTVMEAPLVSFSVENGDSMEDVGLLDILFSEPESNKEVNIDFKLMHIIEVDEDSSLIFYSTLKIADVVAYMRPSVSAGAWVVVLLMTVSVVILFFVFSIVSSPLAHIKRIARVYAKDKDPDRVAESVSKIRSNNEIGVFADEFASLTRELKRHTEEMAHLAEDKERIATELGVATSIQADMLPKIFPPFPERREFDLYATMNPAKEVGGDFYDFYLVDEDHLALTIADVSGKGVPASLFMVISKTILKNRTLTGGTPAEILADTNDMLCEGNDSGLFVTVWHAILTISTGELIVANGGHEYPAMRQGDAPFELVHTNHGPMLGLMEDLTYQNEYYQLSPGDAIFVYTDGVPEATAADESMFSEERLEQVLREGVVTETPREMLGRVQAALDAFVGDAPQFDDVTMLGFVYYGSNTEEGEETHE